MTVLRDLLNRARWRDAGLHALEVHVLHRGAPGDRRVIAGSQITAVRSGGIEIAPDSDEADGVFVPYHRFLAILGPDGAELWSKTPAERRAPALAAAREPMRTETETEIVPALHVVLEERASERPLVIDGSAGEGGGQILRTALALSMATGTPFVIEKIRAGRKKPGLMPQHLMSVKAAGLACAAEVEHATLGSSRVVFRPGGVTGGDRSLDIGSAGSASLVLQTLALPVALAPIPSRITVRGGTHVPWAPPFPFLEEAWLPLVRRAGADLTLTLGAYGFYPAGGGEVVMTASPRPRLRPLHLGDTGVISTLRLRAIVANLSEEIARRALSAAAEALEGTPVELATETVRSPGPGAAIWLVARDEGTGVTNVFSGIGQAGVPAEDIGRNVAVEFLAWRASGTSVEPHLADQIMLPIALAGAGSFTTSELTLHARTNMEVIRAFTGRGLRAWDLGAARIRVALADEP